MASLYSVAAVEKLVKRYEEAGGISYWMGDGGVGCGTVILHDTEGKGLASFVIKEKYLNEWSSAHTIRKYRKLPKCYLQMIDKLMQDEEPVPQFVHFAGGIYE